MEPGVQLTMQLTHKMIDELRSLSRDDITARCRVRYAHWVRLDELLLVNPGLWTVADREWVLQFWIRLCG